MGVAHSWQRSRQVLAALHDSTLRLLLLAALLGMAAALAAFILLNGRSETVALDRLTRVATRLNHLEQTESAAGAMVALGQSDPDVLALVRQGLPASRAMSLRMQRLIRELDLDEVFILDRFGVTVGYYARPGLLVNALGRNLSERPYFQQAIAGHQGAYVAVGTNTHLRGFYLSAPVWGTDPLTPAGVVVGKIGFAGVDQVLQQETMPLAIRSPEGFLFASNNPQWLYLLDQRFVSTRNDLPARMQGARGLLRGTLEIDQNRELNDDEIRGTVLQVPLSWPEKGPGWMLLGVRQFSSWETVLFSLLLGGLVGTLGFFALAWLAARRHLARYASQLEQQNQTLSQLSQTDALTGLGNRRAFDLFFPSAWAFSRHQELPLTLLLVDIDHFKRFNDRFGHLAGDHCLKSVASTLHAQLRRQGDFACRYGGEEFALVLPGMSLADGLAFAELLRQSIARLDIESPDTELGVVTISVGVASCHADQASAQQLFLDADRALYRAKLAGRNGVVCAEAAIL